MKKRVDTYYLVQNDLNEDDFFIVETRDEAVKYCTVINEDYGWQEVSLYKI